jgi:hypothetical protein
MRKPKTTRHQRFSGWRASQTAPTPREVAEQRAAWIIQDYHQSPYWNPRYVAYSASHGMTPAEMQDHDRERFPGGIMTEFSIYIMDHIRQFKVEKGIRDLRELPDLKAGQQEFTQMLLDLAPKEYADSVVGRKETDASGFEVKEAEGIEAEGESNSAPASDPNP